MGNCIITKKKITRNIKLLLPNTQTSASKGMIYNVGSNTYTWDLGTLYYNAVICYSLRQFSSGTDTLSYSTNNSSYTTIVTASVGNPYTGRLAVSSVRYIKYYNSGGYSIRNVAVAVLE